MQFIKNLFTPLHRLSNRSLTLLVIINVVGALMAWQFFTQGGLIPSPVKIAEALIKQLGSKEFWDNLIISMTLTLKGMGYSIIIALVISYLSLIPFFTPLARFIIKCRYLTLTGLVFVFTLLTKDGSGLKMSLLVFGIVPFFVTSFLSIIDSINEEEYQLCKTLRMSSWKTLLEVIIIGRLDQALEVMRQNFAIAWIMIAMVEGLSMSEGGLGTLMIKANKYLDLGSVFGILTVIFAIGVCFDFILKKLRTSFFPYTKIQVRK
jgi:NitT/TauT family transport system permease protein